MKAPGMTMYTNEGHSTAQIIKYVLEDRDPFSTPRYAVEEVFHSTNATRIDNKYEFSFPQSWYNGNLNNKSIGLRKIQIIRRPMIIEFGYSITRKKKNEQGWGKEENKFKVFKIIIPGDWTIERIINEIQFQINNANSVDIGPIEFSYYDQKVHIVQTPYNSDIQIIRACFASPQSATNEGWNNFCKLIFGKTTTSSIELTKTESDFKIESYNNIWDRKNVFFHASFANNSTNNYLCINDEFFYKPSKIYEYNFNSIQFQIWTSINGLTPIYIDDLEFLMELCLMHNDRRVTI